MSNNQQIEVSVIALSDAIVYPWAVMIKAIHAPVALETMAASCGS